MALPVLVTVSGMVGAGKSSAQGRILSVLEREGVRSEAWRFRTLPCFSLPFSRPRRRASAVTQPATRTATRPAVSRGVRYKRKSLTLWATVGYIGRMVAFRAYRRLHGSPGWAVCNRYFYDNLAHFELGSPAARRHLALLRRCMPRPDLALLFVASPATIAARRPQYAHDYLDRVWDAYRDVAAQFPELVVLSSEPDQATLESVELLIARLVSSAR